jgi:hypothetical protein
MPPRRRLQAVPDQPPRERAPDLRDAVRNAVKAMDWLKDSDGAMKTLAMRISEEIEKAIDRAEELEQVLDEAVLRDDSDLIYKRLEKLRAMCDVTKTVGWLGPQLQGVLRDLGGTPAARLAMSKDKPVGGRLAEIRGAASKNKAK